MSTRGFFSFCGDAEEEYHVYKHGDCYPEGPHGGVAAIVRALDKAWPLPRYEADEFAAAFVAANKETQGGVRLCPSGAWQDVAPSDIAYRYCVSFKGRNLNVAVFEADCPDWEKREWKCKLLFSGQLNSAAEWASKVKPRATILQPRRRIRVA